MYDLAKPNYVLHLPTDAFSLIVAKLSNVHPIADASLVTHYQSNWRRSQLWLLGWLEFPKGLGQ